MRRNHLIAAHSLLILLAVLAVSPAARADEPNDFAHDVLPILRARCAKCHSAGKTEGDLSMESRMSLINSKVSVPGDATASLLIARISADDPDERMPPEGDPLSHEQIAAVEQWIAGGAKWEEGILFRENSYVASLAPRRPELPSAQEGRENRVDRLVDQYFAKNHVDRPEPLGDAAFIRRLSMDVVGLLPELSKLDTFCDCDATDKRGQLIQDVLSDDRAYAEHWITFWNDLLRNDYAGTGFVDGGRKPISEWLYRALLANKPYDQFVRELIVPTPESEGFIRGIVWRGRVNASQVVELQFAQNVSQVFLGVNLKCASCHDSFVNGWKLADAYGLAAVAADRPLELHRCDKPTGQMAEAQFLFPELGTIDGSLPREERLAQFADLLTDEQNGRFARTIVNRLWQRLMGRGIIDPIDAMDNDPFSQDLLDHLSVDLVPKQA